MCFQGNSTPQCPESTWFSYFSSRKTWYKMPIHYLNAGKNEVGWNPKIAGSLEAQRFIDATPWTFFCWKLFTQHVARTIAICVLDPAAGSHAEGSWSSVSKAPQLEDSCEHVGTHGRWCRSTMCSWFVHQRLDVPLVFTAKFAVVLRLCGARKHLLITPTLAKPNFKIMNVEHGH